MKREKKLEKALELKRGGQAWADKKPVGMTARCVFTATEGYFYHD